MARFRLPRAPAEYRHLGRTLVLTVAVGVAAGLGACLFHVGVEWTRHLLLGQLVHFRAPQPAGEVSLFAEVPGPFRRWLLALMPALGGLLSGLLVARFAPEAAGGGGDAYIDAFHNRRGTMRTRVPLVKGVASILVLGSGGSAGREGPIMQIGAGIGAAVARALGLSDAERRLLLVAGTAAGMAAIFRTPLGAAIFAVEVLYRDDFEAAAIVPSIIASVTAYSVFITVFGEQHLFATAEHYPFSPLTLPLYVAMAVVVSLAARGFSFLLHASRERVWSRLPVPAWSRPAVGGLAMGLIALGVPQVAGLGYGWLQEAILWRGVFPLGWGTVALLGGIALAKMLATSCTISSGGSGGDFGPSLVVGGLVGAACGQAWSLLLPSLGARPGAFALVGMATFFGGIAHVPIASLIMVCELTGSYELLVPLMFTEGIAFILLRRHALYHAQLPNQASSPAHTGELAIDILASLTVADALDARAPPVEPVRADMPLHEFLHQVAATNHATYPVAGPDGRIVGLVGLSSVRSLLQEDVSSAPLLVADALGPPVVLTARTPLSDALERLIGSAHEELPVVEAERVVGMVGFPEVMRCYNAELARRRGAGRDA